MKERIIQKLTQELAPSRLEVIDESFMHAGHSGSREGGETHFRIKIVSPKFDNLSLVESHRIIYKILDTEISERIHALAIEVSKS